MMRSKPYSRSSVRRALLLNLSVILFLFSGCSLSTAPTYIKEGLDKAIQDICKKEYSMDVKVTLSGSTLWVYLPVEDMLAKSDKPEKYLEKFIIDDNKVDFKEGLLKLDYMIKSIPENEKTQEYKYNKAVLDKINNVWKALRRVLFSMERSKEGNEPKFLCLVTADIKNGFETKEISYYQDLKKVSYEFISWTEYQHRVIEQSEVSSTIMGDMEGKHMDYKDISMEEFIAFQIKHRIKLKFQKPEVGKDIDIDKEILKIAAYTIRTYDIKNFTGLELNNLVTNNRIVLNRAALWARPIE
ncbi:MAG: hypothetical protein WC723_01300 [Candidatus Omnitrophota bacterium]